MEKYNTTLEDLPCWRFIDYISTNADLHDGYSGMAVCVTDHSTSNLIIMHAGCAETNARKGHGIQVLGWSGEPEGLDIALRPKANGRLGHTVCSLVDRSIKPTALEAMKGGRPQMAVTKVVDARSTQSAGV